MKILRSGIFVGFISGAFLFIVCALVEYMTHLELMTLLLNVDFITAKDLHIALEILFHMIVSIIIAVLLKFIFDKLLRLYIFSLIFSWIVTSLLFFVLDYLSVTSIQLHGFSGFIVWIIVHFLYFIIIYKLHKKGY